MRRRSRLEGSTFFDVNRAIASELSAAKLYSDAIKVDFSWSISARLIFDCWETYTKVSVLNGQFEDGSLDTWTGAIALAVPDLITEGSLFEIIGVAQLKYDKHYYAMSQM
ncbi:MAG: hypothetical protein ACRC1Z_14835 [Waterburya sp.]